LNERLIYVNIVGFYGIIFDYQAEKEMKNEKLNNNYTPGIILPKSINFCVKDTQIEIINTTMQSQKTYLNKKLNNIYKLIKLYSTLKHLKYVICVS